MKTMFVLMSHPMTEEQRTDAQKRYGVERFVFLDREPWSQIHPEDETVLPHLAKLRERLKKEAKPGDILFVQGDFGATYVMVQFAHTLKMIPVYATTRREAEERVEGDRIITTRVFRHVRFREYERIG